MKNEKTSSLQRKKFVYVTAGNFPSRWAHCIQIDKMANAFSTYFGSVSVITSCGFKQFISRSDRRKRVKQGIKVNDYRLVRIPISWSVEEPFPIDYYPARYPTLAVNYATWMKPDVIYTRSFRILNKLVEKGRAVVWETHEATPEDDCHVFKSPYLRGLVTISEDVANQAVQKGYSPHRTLVLPSGVDLNEFEPQISKQEARELIGLPHVGSDGLVLVYSGHLYKIKGIPLILDLAAKRPDITIIVVGGWENHVEKLQSRILERGLKNVWIVGHQNRETLKNYLFAADAFLLPTSKIWSSSDSTSPLKLFEYMAARRPILASRLKNIESVVVDRKEAMLFEPDDLSSLSQAIQCLEELGDTGMSIADAAYERVKSFTWDERAEKIAQFLLDQGVMNDSDRKIVSG